VVQNDRDGHLYIDLAGTTRLFGPRIDCAVRLRNSIAAETGLDPSMAIASNKLVAKVATRAIRPSGLACISPGDEATFLSPQDATLLPGIGPSLRRLLAVAALHEIGDIARLNDSQTVALFGKQGFALRSAARGEDSTRVDPVDITIRTIHRRIDFSEPVIDEQSVHAAILQASEDAGLEMRKSLLQASVVRVTLAYADGARSQGTIRSAKRLLLDSELASAASEALFHARSRRIRLQGLSVSLEGLAPALREPDLFTIVQDTKKERIQYAADLIRIKFGMASVTKAAGIAHA
jgi:DNA polymerase-4